MIPDSITSLGKYAFGFCPNLTSVFYDTYNPITAHSLTFYDLNDAATLYVPESTVEKCDQTYPWALFCHIVAYDFSGVEEISADFNTDLPYEIYNLKGELAGNSLEALTTGIYIIRQGAKTNKVAVK